MSTRSSNLDWFTYVSRRVYDAARRLSVTDRRGRIPHCTQRTTPVKYGKRQYTRRNRMEIMFGRLNGCRHVASRYDRRSKAFLSSIALAATSSIGNAS